MQAVHTRVLIVLALVAKGTGIPELNETHARYHPYTPLDETSQKGAYILVRRPVFSFFCFVFVFFETVTQRTPPELLVWMPAGVTTVAPKLFKYIKSYHLMVWYPISLKLGAK